MSFYPNLDTRNRARLSLKEAAEKERERIALLGKAEKLRIEADRMYLRLRRLRRKSRGGKAYISLYDKRKIVLQRARDARKDFEEYETKQ